MALQPKRTFVYVHGNQARDASHINSYLHSDDPHARSKVELYIHTTDGWKYMTPDELPDDCRIICDGPYVKLEKSQGRIAVSDIIIHQDTSHVAR